MPFFCRIGSANHSSGIVPAIASSTPPVTAVKPGSCWRAVIPSFCHAAAEGCRIQSRGRGRRHGALDGTSRLLQDSDDVRPLDVLERLGRVFAKVHGS
jgi:hypothetical protein